MAVCCIAENLRIVDAISENKYKADDKDNLENL